MPVVLATTAQINMFTSILLNI